MKRLNILILLAFIAACSHTNRFTGYLEVDFGLTHVNESQTKKVQILNESFDEIQHIDEIVFCDGSNDDGNFKVKSVTNGLLEVGSEDVIVPPQGFIQIELEYAPKSAVFDEKAVIELQARTFTCEIPEDAVEAKVIMAEKNIRKTALDYQKLLFPKTVASENNGQPAVHLSTIAIVFDQPYKGYAHIRLVGTAVED